MTKKINFTKRSIEALKPPANGHVYLYDSGQANLGLCLLASGIRTFYWIGRDRGRPERARIGRFPDVTVENARKAAAAKSGDRAKGLGVKVKGDRKGSVEALFKHWLTHAKLRKKTWQADQDNFDYHFGPIRTRPFATLSTDDVAKWHTAIGRKRGPIIANRCRALLSAIYGKAHELGFDGPNPCLKVERFPEKSRERFLLPDEMQAFIEAVKAEPPTWRDFWQLCLFTGARRGNVAAMRWDNVDLAAGIWYLPGEKLKNGLPLAIVLPPQAVAILKARADELKEQAAERKEKPEFVFPAEGERGHIADPRKSWARVILAAGTPNLHPHDLRRSLGSWQALAGSSLQVIGQSLGHRDVKSTQVYARLLLDPIRSSVNGAVAAMLTAAEPKPKKPATTIIEAGTAKPKKAVKTKGVRNGKAK